MGVFFHFINYYFLLKKIHAIKIFSKKSLLVLRLIWLLHQLKIFCTYWYHKRLIKKIYTESLVKHSFLCSKYLLEYQCQKQKMGLDITNYFLEFIAQYYFSEFWYKAYILKILKNASTAMYDCLIYLFLFY